MVENGSLAPPPQAARWAIEPARAELSPFRDRLERASFRRGWRLVWDRHDSADGFSTLQLSIVDADLRRVRRVSMTKKSDRFAEGSAAEGIAEWLMDPLPADVISAGRSNA